MILDHILQSNVYNTNTINLLNILSRKTDVVSTQVNDMNNNNVLLKTE